MPVPEHIIFDVDGVLTTGQFLYSENGKIAKMFGPHDHDGIKLITPLVRVAFITADKQGFEITKRRIVTDMGHELYLVSESDRYQFLEREYGLKKTIYMADGYYDAPILKECLYGITPASARVEAKEAADFVTPSRAGDGAVLDACLHIVGRFFNKRQDVS